MAIVKKNSRLINWSNSLVWSWSNFHILLFRDPELIVWSSKDGCAEHFEMQADKNCPSIYSLFACFTNALVTWHCYVIAVSSLLDRSVIYIHSYFLIVLHLQKIWHAGHDETMANFMSVGYVHNRCRCQYSNPRVNKTCLLKKIKLQDSQNSPLTGDFTNCYTWESGLPMAF